MVLQPGKDPLVHCTAQLYSVAPWCSVCNRCRAQMSASAVPDQGLLQLMLAHPYFGRAPPKTTGREEFSTTLAEEWLQTARSATPTVGTASDSHSAGPLEFAASAAHTAARGRP